MDNLFEEYVSQSTVSHTTSYDNYDCHSDYGYDDNDIYVDVDESDTEWP